MEPAYHLAPSLTSTHTAATVILLERETVTNHGKRYDGFSQPLTHTSPLPHRKTCMTRPALALLSLCQVTHKDYHLSHAKWLTLWHLWHLSSPLPMLPHHCSSSALPWRTPSLHTCQRLAKAPPPIRSLLKPHNDFTPLLSPSAILMLFHTHFRGGSKPKFSALDVNITRFTF